jgi:hypothetical protein
MDYIAPGSTAVPFKFVTIAYAPPTSTVVHLEFSDADPSGGADPSSARPMLIIVS